MTYKFVSFDVSTKKSYLWGTFVNPEDTKKLFLFVSYLMGANNPEEFFILEEETGKTVKMLSFAEKNNITKEDIKRV